MHFPRLLTDFCRPSRLLFKILCVEVNSLLFGKFYTRQLLRNSYILMESRQKVFNKISQSSSNIPFVLKNVLLYDSTHSILPVSMVTTEVYSTASSFR